MEEAEAICDRVAIMNAGKIVELGTPASLIDKLLSKGFKTRKPVKAANLEDVFIDLTGYKPEDIER
jgi:ABC-2 type transport system ATP-binding protein